MLFVVEGNNVYPVGTGHPLPISVAPGTKVATSILTIASLAGGDISAIGACTSVDLSDSPPSLALTVIASYNGVATQGLRVHVRTSHNDLNWDTEDWDSWDPGFAPGAVIQQTKNYDTDPMYVRVMLENLDPVRAITNISVIATVGG